MSQGKLDVGVFNGEEFAWASAKHAGLKAMAMAVNVYRYPVVYIVTNRSNPAKDFVGLQGQTISIPDTGQSFLRLFVNRQCELNGKKASTFFAKITSPASVEDAIDDVVDGVTQGIVVDRAALEAYKQRKPARFSKLKPIAHSPPMLPAIVAYYEKHLDDATRRRFDKGLLDANRNEKGKLMLALFHLTGFDPVPSDFDTVVARMQGLPGAEDFVEVSLLRRLEPARQPAPVGCRNRSRRANRNISRIRNPIADPGHSRPARGPAPGRLDHQPAICHGISTSWLDRSPRLGGCPAGLGGSLAREPLCRPTLE